MCTGGHGCPGLFELKTGDFAVIGKDITTEAVSWLPPGSSCGPSERIIAVPRDVMIQARPDIPRS